MQQFSKILAFGFFFRMVLCFNVFPDFKTGDPADLNNIIFYSMP